MLTQEQKSELTRLMTDCPIPKLKKVLEEGLPRFISDEITPIQGDEGVIEKNGTYLSSTNNCCLLGAAVIGKSSRETFQFDLHELGSITGSFDNRCMRIFHDQEIYDYVAQIRKVIFGC